LAPLSGIESCIFPGKNEKVSDLIVDGEQRLDNKQDVYHSPGDSNFEESKIQIIIGDSTVQG
jgi:hypothetical protein